MAQKKKTRPRVPPVLVAAVVRPVAARLSRIEDLLIEIRHELDVKHKAITRLRRQLDDLTDTVGQRLSLTDRRGARGSAANPSGEIARPSFDPAK